MALIGEMQYLTIGGNTYSLPSGGGGSVTSIAVSNATNGGLSVSGSPISSSGTITIGHSNVLSSAQTTQAVYPIKIDKNGHISAYGTAVTISDTKNTAGSTDSNSKLFLIGATSQAANPQTYSHDTAYVGTDGYLYSNSNKVLVEKYGTDSTGVVITPYVSEYGSNFSIYCNRNDNTNNAQQAMQLNVSDGNVNIADVVDERAFIAVYARSLYPNGNVFITGLPTPTQNDQAANKKYIDDSINALDGSITGTAGAGKTLTAFSQTNGKVTATFGNISITKSQISDFPTIPDVSGKIDTAGTGLSKSGTTLNHSNSVTAQTTQAVYPIKIDAQGHISAYGSAQTILSIGTTSSTAAAGNHTHDIGLGSTTDTTSGVTLASATKYKLTAGGKSVYFTMPTIPTVPSNIVNTITTTAGTHTTISSQTGTVSFNVPTKTSHLTNDSGFITSYTDEKVKVSASSSSTIYYPILATTTGTATRQIDSSFGGLTYISIPGTTSTIGTATLQLGNETASGTANNENGILRMCGTTTKYHSLQAVSGYPAANRSVYFPRYANNMYLTCTSNTSAVGGATTKPVYVDDTGCIQAVTSIPYSLLTGAPTSMTPTSHTHGNITNGGDITATAPTIASGDQLIINDDSASKVTNGPTFDGSTTTKALSQKGTWETFSNSLLYGECTIAAATAAKTVTVNSSFKLVTGATIAVKFSNTNTADAPTLNVNSTGAKALKRTNSTYAGTSSHTSWVAGETVPLLYDGSSWLIMNNMAQNNYVTQSYSSSNTDYNLALSAYTSTNGGATTLNHSNKIKGNPSTGRITTADLSSSDIDTFVDSLNYSQINAVDYVVEQGASGNWHYRKWNSGIGECWLPSYNPGTYTIGTTRGSLYSGANLTLTFPIVFTSSPSVTGNVSLGTDAYVVWLQFNGLGTTTAQCRMVSSGSVAANSNYLISVYVIGRWK